MGLSNNLSCEAGSFSCCHLNSHRCFQSEVWGFISPSWNPGLHGLSRSQLFLQVYLYSHVGPQSPQVITLPPVFSAQLPISAPPTGLDECVFSNSLVAGLPYSLIFCQFWLVFVFKLLLSFFWLCEEAQCVYLCFHLGRNSFLRLTLHR